jgi:hypothetical protein
MKKNNNLFCGNCCIRSSFTVSLGIEKAEGLIKGPGSGDSEE